MKRNEPVTVWLSLGSNIGERESYISQAFALLCGFIDSCVQAPLYETAAQDYENQPDFLNTVVSGKTGLSPKKLLERLQAIERTLGRDRSTGIPKGPRTLDIDILLYGNRVIDAYTEGSNADGAGAAAAGLIVPHQSMHRRLFVLKPLLDLDPQLSDPRDDVLWAEKASHLLHQEVKLYVQ